MRGVDGVLAFGCGRDIMVLSCFFCLGANRGRMRWAWKMGFFFCLTGCMGGAEGVGDGRGEVGGRHGGWSGEEVRGCGDNAFD